MDTNTAQVRTATLVAEVEASGLEVGTKVRVVSALVPHTGYVPGTPGVDPAYYMVTVDEEQEFLDLESTTDILAAFMWEYGTTVWAEPQALRFDEDES
jgi:hypothetical protein